MNFFPRNTMLDGEYDCAFRCECRHWLMYHSAKIGETFACWSCDTKYRITEAGVVLA